MQKIYRSKILNSLLFFKILFLDATDQISALTYKERVIDNYKLLSEINSDLSQLIS